MSQYADMFNINLIDLNVSKSDQLDIFNSIYQELRKKEYVDDHYLESLISREERFPTGLITQNMNIALPHTDPQVIKKPFVFICRLNAPIKFKQMGDNQEMDVQNLFFLGIKNPREQVGLLQAFMNLFMDSDFVSSFKKMDSKKEIIDLFQTNI
ncbi:PTS sugar transporter subunit IIA [Enterococcus sp. LJL99]